MKPTLIFIFVFICFISITLSCVCNHGTCNGAICVCNEYYEGSDCSIYNREITAGIALSDSISEYNWKYYHFSPSNSDTSMTISLTQTSNGDVDVYVSTSAYPSATNYVNYDDSSDTHVTMTLSVNSPIYYIGLYGYSTCNYNLEIDVQEGCINNCNGNGECDMDILTCNCFTPYTGSDCSIYNEEIALGITYRGHINNHQWVYYHFTSTEVSDLSVIMTQVQGSSIQLFVKKTYYPSFASFDYANTTLSTQVEIHVQNLDPADWVIGLYGYVGGIYSLTADLLIPEIPHCTNDCSLHGTCESQICTCNEGYLGDACEYMVQLSGFDEEYSGLVSASYWNYYPVQFVTSQSINVHLRKLNGNCNLYIRPLAYPTRVSYEYFDASSSQEVDLIIQYPGSSIWYVGVYGYSDCNYTVEFSFIDRCQCSEGANGYCETGSTYCVCDPGWAGTGCDVQATRLESFDVVFEAVQKNEMKYYYVVSNSSALIITMVEKNTKSFAWLLIGTDGYPSLDDHDDLNYGYAGELSFHENRYLWSSKRERTHYITVLGSSVDVSPDPVQYAITVYSTPF